MTGTRSAFGQNQERRVTRGPPGAYHDGMSLRNPSRLGATLLIAAALVFTTGCDYYARPGRGLPEGLTFITGEGRSLRPTEFRGQPLIIHAWVPG